MSPKRTDHNLESDYDPNLSDAENAEHLGLKRYIVRYWRIKNGIPPRKRKINEAEFLKLYQFGYSDTKIASIFNTTPTNVYFFRTRRGLPSNFPHGLVNEILENYVPSDEEKPWHDPESLFCDVDFLEKFKRGDVRL